ncbi:hypothetical protein JW887_06155 [Candidatus Dojkabacteria bacterium]|nr:hypothetical protein [Candidatus Dojkabacteria bacterium]
MYPLTYLDILEEDLVLLNQEEPKNTSRVNLHEKYKDKFLVNPTLNRSLISFQANKSEPIYRWFKYKEGFSSKFVKYILNKFKKAGSNQVVLDPFSGIGTTITSAMELGYNSIGIELLPPAILATEARILTNRINIQEFHTYLSEIKQLNFNDKSVSKKYFFKHLTITKGAFPDETEIGIAVMNKFVETKISNQDIQTLIRFAVSSILEDVSFTRKDGQYLRWDHRSNRNLKADFNKGIIFPFRDRLIQKLTDIITDIQSTPQKESSNTYTLINGSSLFELHNIDNEYVDLVITSPPYCNRYDYTRTYALELAYNGIDDNSIKQLRQTLLSATVENKSKFINLQDFYECIGKKEVFESLVSNFKENDALNEALRSLNYHRNILNNKNIPIMVANYFFEMNLIIAELARILKKGGKIIMVNDNVRYNGDEIQVDLILSEFASKLGLKTDVIWILERGKGNSSQQMGVHGRQELRKCVYVWTK